MPELPEVETVRQGLAPVVTGAHIERVQLNRPNLRFAFPADFTERLNGRRILHVGRRAKYLQFDLDSGETLLGHLGMTGNFRFSDEVIVQPTRVHESKTTKHDHVLFALETNTKEKVTLIYSDPRRFGFMDIYKSEADCAYLNALGPEPLGNEMTAQHLADRFTKRRTPIKSALLDQRNIAGLGNIYVCEALWRAGVSPLTLAGGLVDTDQRPKRVLERLSSEIQSVLRDAIAAGGSTLKDFRQADGESGYFQHAFDVYDRENEPCRRDGCAGSIERIVQSGRSSFYCQTCQPEIS